ncbi:PREDICTED: uncharacterized protein LOC109590683 isoform X1 [Amphimedon queenslandica]|uniref:Uncharacterized protein n=1 Tax=Amphimedon queenslandica TaxID=400682 RepID=A0A1X7SZQ6_AMPQE|nr:PREDICTED: uncharacterized protein LOC109590683 isoform X1 [Amphimedon queenslandica]XP_019862130.1 PREDICTED: uncharacterized protein LOC109590683 isoform X1 [Amphimedon queenslandica]|eukprot:XP_019862129.1 PREDICTED: uncharacterized protein LOC109590683 isoform X1 [Amphimedon queenslandica]
MYLVKHMNAITGFVSMPLYQECNITIIFSNGAGSTEPFILPLDTHPVSAGLIVNVAILTSLGIIILSLMMCLTVSVCSAIIYKRKLHRAGTSLQKQKASTATNEAYQINSLMIYSNPVYEEIEGNRRELINNPVYGEVKGSKRELISNPAYGEIEGSGGELVNNLAYGKIEGSSY